MSETRLPFGTARECGMIFENIHSAGMLVLQLREAQLEGSANRMQMVASELAELASRAAVLSAQLERTLAKHQNQRGSLGGVRFG